MNRFSTIAVFLLVSALFNMTIDNHHPVQIYPESVVADLTSADNYSVHNDLADKASGPVTNSLLIILIPISQFLIFSLVRARRKLLLTPVFYQANYLIQPLNWTCFIFIQRRVWNAIHSIYYHWILFLNSSFDYDVSRNWVCSSFNWIFQAQIIKREKSRRHKLPSGLFFSLILPSHHSEK